MISAIKMIYGLVKVYLRHLRFLYRNFQPTDWSDPSALVQSGFGPAVQGSSGGKVQM